MDTEYREIQALLVTDKGVLTSIIQPFKNGTSSEHTFTYAQTRNEDVLVYTTYTHKPLNTVLLPFTNTIAELTKQNVQPKVFSVLEYQNSIDRWIKPNNETYAFPYFMSQTENESYAILEFYFPTLTWKTQISQAMINLKTHLSEIIEIHSSWKNYMTYFTLKLQGETFEEIQPRVEHVTNEIFHALSQLIEETEPPLMDTQLDFNFPTRQNRLSLNDRSLEEVIIETFISKKTKGVIYLKQGACPINIEIFGDVTTIFPVSMNHPIIPYAQISSQTRLLQEYYTS